MLKLFQKVHKLLLSNRKPKVEDQSYYTWMYQTSLRGMNIGGGAFTDSSGERFVVEYLRNKWQDPGTERVLFDVGANTGKYSMMLLEVLNGVKKTIYCFEPSAFTFAELTNTLKTAADVKLFRLAIGEKNGYTTLFSDASGSGLASIYQRKLDHFSIDFSKSESVTIETLDSFVQRNGLQKVDFLKLDVEGHELGVLRGAGQLIADGKVDYIQFEFGGCNIDSRTYFQDFYYLLKDKYRLFRILPDGIQEIKSYHENLEIFLTTNYLAVRNQCSV